MLHMICCGRKGAPEAEPTLHVLMDEPLWVPVPETPVQSEIDGFGN